MINDKILVKNHDYNIRVRAYLEESMRNCGWFLRENFSDFEISDYIYNVDEATWELGLDSDLINQLIEDYVIQILKSKVLFSEYLQKLQEVEEVSGELDYTQLRDLAHKNLGVARNLRIKDAIKILDELMKKDDLKYLALCIEALESCAIRLKPKCAYKTLKLINIKSSL